MTNIDGHGMGFTELNEAIRRSDGVCRITGLLGQRFLCAGMSDRSITLEGIPGNALGAYLNGGSITVRGNAQDAVGDTMNDAPFSSTAAWETPRAMPCGAGRFTFRAAPDTGRAST